MRFIRGPVIGALATCMALSSTLTGSAVAAPTQAAPDAREVQTAYGLTAAGYGTRVQGGDVPAESGRTAFSIIACTKLAGLEKRNQLLGLINREDVKVKGVTTRQWTTRQQNTRNGVTVSSHSLTKVTSVQLGDTGDSPLLSGLELEGLRLKTRAFHDDRGFRTERDLTFTSAKLAGVNLPGLLDPSVGQTLEVPGVGTVTFFSGVNKRSASGAAVEAKGLKIRLDGTDTIVTVGSAMSRINNRVPAGVLGGFGRAGNARTLDGTIVSGKIAVQILPCQGTDGEWVRNATGRLDLPGTLVLGGAVGSARGDQFSKTRAYGQTRGKITRAAIGGELVIRAIKAQANVRKDGNRLIKSAKGTSVGSIRLGGELQDVPGAGETVNFGGVAKVTGRKVVRTEFGIRVIALQVQLLDGSFDDRINLGEAFTRITPN